MQNTGLNVKSRQTKPAKCKDQKVQNTKNIQVKQYVGTTKHS